MDLGWICGIIALLIFLMLLVKVGGLPWELAKAFALLIVAAIAALTAAIVLFAANLGKPRSHHHAHEAHAHHAHAHDHEEHHEGHGKSILGLLSEREWVAVLVLMIVGVYFLADIRNALHFTIARDSRPIVEVKPPHWGLGRDNPLITLSMSSYDPGLSTWTGDGPQFTGSGFYTATKFWARGKGQFAYRFKLNDLPSKKVEVKVVLSSELKDRVSGNPKDASDVRLLVNNELVGKSRVIPDDGKGKEYTWGVAAPYWKKGENILAIQVKGERENGLCIYRSVTLKLQ